ncbi:hypothetical protein predicted by Glimmer/Critica [Sorangium cellulosum So ce56]|uniref:Secreted protein n=1 Tax=Sorangium cellulosum (strain So ce56) TaxID=448385 RepID=A9GG64_SORC5|nr:hypothetical protein predicted by Glimmer/Critica [Sorangium cellulosum So ce56]
MTNIYAKLCQLTLLTTLVLACGQTTSDGASETSSTGSTGGSAGSGGTGGTGGSGSGGTAGQGGAEPECSVDEDCRLASDCCTCGAYPASAEAPEACAEDCDQYRCERYAVERAMCFAGRCTVATSHNCSPLFAECDALPPECPEGTLPSVADNRCWTGQCVPIELCGFRPDCTGCDDDHVCFRGFNDAAGTPYYCQPRPLACEGQVTCACASALCSSLGFQSCTDADDGVMQCSP